MAYRYEATEKFWAGFYDLKDSQKESIRRVWKLFRQDPFDARLGTRRDSSAQRPLRQNDLFGGHSNTYLV